MKKIMIPLVLGWLLVNSCSSSTDQLSPNYQDAESLKSTKITLRYEEDAETLFLSDNSGLKSGALDFVSELSTGDTISWHLNENSKIKSIEEIIIVSSTCGEASLFEDGIQYNQEGTFCYGVISQAAYGVTKYDIKFMLENGIIVIIDPTIRVKEINPPPREQ